MRTANRRITRTSQAILAGAVLIAGLSGCQPHEKATGHGTVSGEILSGSVSDAMLPYDSVKSKAPLAPDEPVGRSGTRPDAAAADSAVPDAALPDSAAPDNAASPGPAAPVTAN